MPREDNKMKWPVNYMERIARGLILQVNGHHRMNPSWKGQKKRAVYHFLLEFLNKTRAPSAQVIER